MFPDDASSEFYTLLSLLPALPKSADVISAKLLNLDGSSFLIFKMWMLIVDANQD